MCVVYFSYWKKNHQLFAAMGQCKDGKRARIIWHKTKVAKANPTSTWPNTKSGEKKASLDVHSRLKTKVINDPRSQSSESYKLDFINIIHQSILTVFPTLFVDNLLLGLNF